GARAATGIIAGRNGAGRSARSRELTVSRGASTSRTTRLHEIPKEIEEFGGSAHHSLGMKLHRAAIPGPGFFHRLDNPIRSAGDDVKAARDTIDGLMVTGIHPVETAHRSLESPALCPFDSMGQRVGLRIAMSVDVRNQCAAERDVHHLNPATNPKDGLVALGDLTQNVDFYLVTDFVRAANLLAQRRRHSRRVKLRSDIAAARQQPAVAGIDIMVEYP